MPTALILGSGIAGLTSALRLLEAGWRVRMWSADDPLNTVSAVAAAVWYPYKAYPADRVGAWGARTFDVLAAEAHDGVPGVTMADGMIVWHNARPDDALDGLPSPQHARSWTPTIECAGWQWIRVPLAEMTTYLRSIEARVVRAGGSIERRRAVSIGQACTAAQLLEIECAVVNCTGLGARSLVGDARLRPIRGQVVWIENPGLDTFIVDVDDPGGATYVVPRTRDCVLGGTAEVDDWNAAPNESTAKDILARCERLEPRVRGARVLAHKAGLRPGRDAVRLERVDDGGVPVVHNYGHGGAGVTLSWGCAEEVVRLLSS